MTIKKHILFGLLFLCQFAMAQNDSINRLEEVIVSDRQLKGTSNTQSVQRLSDTIISRNQSSLTSL